VNRVAIRLGVVAGCLILIAGCSRGPSPSEQNQPAKPNESVTLKVYAAASLKDTFTDLGRKYEADHDGVNVAFNFGGSSDLVAQIQQGAPADVFASADQKNMDKLVADDLIAGTASPFASNTLEIAVPPTNPAHVTSLKDLSSRDVDVVVCAPEVPCGSAATKVADAAHLRFHTVSEEQSVTDVLNKVTTGQAEAGLVYITDIKAAGDSVKGITIPVAENAVNVYPIAAVRSGKHVTEARAFVDLVLSPVGQDALQDAGFAKP
jgi:molybdate transport system substrate-binding protein